MIVLGTVLNGSASPWTNPFDPLDLNASNEPAWRIIHRRELHTSSNIYFSQSLQQFRRSAFINMRLAIKHSILGKSHGAFRIRLKRDRHAWIATDVLDLAVFWQMPRNDVIPIETNPDESELGTAISIKCDQVRGCSQFDEITYLCGIFM